MEYQHYNIGNKGNNRVARWKKYSMRKSEATKFVIENLPENIHDL